MTRSADTALKLGGLVLPVFLLFGLTYLLPLGKLVLTSFYHEGSFSLTTHIGLLASSGFRSIALRTVQMAAIVTIGSLLLGYPTAYFLSRMQPARAAILLIFVTIPYLTSILIRSYAWIVLLGPKGVINNALISTGVIDQPIRMVFNTLGADIAMIQIQLPLMIFVLYASMVGIDRKLLDAAQSLGSSRASGFLNVYLPQSLSAVAAGCTLVFLSCLGFYVTPALLGGPGDYMIAQAIQVRVSNLGDYEGAAGQSSILLAAIVLAFFLLRKRVVAVLSDETSKNSAQTRPHDKRYWLPEGFARSVAPFLAKLGEAISAVRVPILVMISTASLLYLLLPMVIVAILAFSDATYLTFPPPAYSMRWFWNFFSDGRWTSALLFSVAGAGLSAILSVLIGAPATFAIVRRQFPGRLAFYLLLISPLIVPHIIIGVAALLAFVRLGLVGSLTGFVLAYSVIAIPYVTVLFINGLRSVDRSLEMAAAGLGAPPHVVLRTVTLPLIVPTIISAFLFAFLAGFDDVEIGLFLSGPTTTPLPIRMMENIRFEISPQIAVVGVLLLAALVVGFLLFRVATAAVGWARA